MNNNEASRQPLPSAGNVNILARNNKKSKAFAYAAGALIIIALLLLCFMLRDKIIPGWHENESGKYHISLVGKDTGLKKISGEYYMFSYKGYLLTGWNKYGDFYYYSDENGKVIRSEYTINGENYNFD